MKKFLILVIFLIFSGVGYASDISTIASSKGSISSQFASGLGLGFYKSGSGEVGVLAWHPDFRYGIFGIGLDVNIFIGQNRPAELNNIVVRFVELDNGRMGLRYGVLQNITMGYGLLVNNYSTNIAGGSILNNDQTGVRAYYKNDKYGIEAIGTRSNVYSGRLTEKLLPMLVLGQTYATDRVQSGFALDAGIPLTDWAAFYAEYAHLNNHGSGFTAGFGAGQDFTIFAWGFKAERRLIDANFVPAYFNADHDIDPINMASVEASGVSKDGYLVALTGKVLDLAKFAATYENYNGGNPSLIAEASANLYSSTFVYGSYSQPNFQDFRSLSFEQGSIAIGKLGYKINPYTMVVANYKKAYDPAQGRVIESNWYEVSFVF